VASWAGADTGDGGGSRRRGLAHVDRGGPDRQARLSGAPAGGQSGGLSAARTLPSVVDVGRR
jgi:hypothetical protein